MTYSEQVKILKYLTEELQSWETVRKFREVDWLEYFKVKNIAYVPCLRGEDLW